MCNHVSLKNKDINFNILGCEANEFINVIRSTRRSFSLLIFHTARENAVGAAFLKLFLSGDHILKSEQFRWPPYSCSIRMQVH